MPKTDPVARRFTPMPKTDPVVKTIKHAKSLSLKKWHKIRKELVAVLIHASQECGFCFYNRTNSQPYICLECPVKEKRQELDEQVNIFLSGSLTYIEEDLIPYIENFQLNGEAS